MFGDIRKAWIVPFRRRDARGLIRWLHGIDRPPVGRYVAVEGEYRRSIEDRRRRFGLALQKPSVELRAEIRRGVTIFRRARTNEPEMVQIRAAEGAGEEVICERVFLRPLPQGVLRAVVIGNGEAVGVGRGDV